MMTAGGPLEVAFSRGFALSVQVLEGESLSASAAGAGLQVLEEPVAPGPAPRRKPAFHVHDYDASRGELRVGRGDARRVVRSVGQRDYVHVVSADRCRWTGRLILVELRLVESSEEATDFGPDLEWIFEHFCPKETRAGSERRWVCDESSPGREPPDRAA